jgi:glycosyltransferase involved in cell wall biosynthesis
MLPPVIVNLQKIILLMQDIKPGHGASVIVCCFNSSDRLPATLRYLDEQIIPNNFAIEIVIVNNASTDDTLVIAKQQSDKILPKNISYKIINEEKPGQMHARKRGAIEAAFDCIVFCDDDNWLDKNYVYLSYQLLKKDSCIGAGGGRNLPVTNADAYPEWFEQYKDKYGMSATMPESGDVSFRTFVLGAGLVTKRSLFLAAFDDKFPSLLNGRDGSKLSTGDDFEYCKRLLLWGYKLYYDEKMILHHFVPKERLTVEYRDRLMEGILQAGVILHEYDLAIHIFKKIKNKNKWRLLILSPFRITLARLGWSKRSLTDEKLTLYYLSPFRVKDTFPKREIKKFIQLS